MIAILVLSLTLQAATPEPPAASAPAPPSAPPSAPPPATEGADFFSAEVRGAFARSQNLQGPLDGAWVMKAAAGDGLYRVQLVDPGYSGGAMEGVWSDMKAKVRTGGFFTAIGRDGTKLVLDFGPAGSATLEARGQGGYAGELVVAEPGREPRKTPVILVRP